MPGGDLFFGAIALGIGFVGGYVHEPDKDPMERLIRAGLFTAVLLIIVAVAFDATVTIVFKTSDIRRPDDFALPIISGGLTAWSAYFLVIVVGFVAGWLYADSQREARRR